MTLADLAAACDPPTTAQTIGRLETGMRNLSVKWMDRIASALNVSPELLVRADERGAAQIVATLGENGAEALTAPRDAILPTELGGDALQMVLNIDVSAGEYRRGDQLWLRQIHPESYSRALNRDVLMPRRAGRFAFGRLIDHEGARFAILPPGAGQKQVIVEDPAWLALAEMLVRPL